MTARLLTACLLLTPVLASAAACVPATATLKVVDTAGTAHEVDLRTPFAKSTVVAAKNKDGSTTNHDAIPLAVVLAAAGLPSGEALRGKPIGWTVFAKARDGYRAAFALAELDAGIGGKAVWLAACRDGAPLDADVGPLRLLVPDDQRPARAIRQLEELHVLDDR